MEPLDARGYSCPEPVLMTKKALKGATLPLTVLVDNTAAVGNITRMAQNAGHTVLSRPVGEDYEVVIS